MNRRTRHPGNFIIRIERSLSTIFPPLFPHPFSAACMCAEFWIGLSEHFRKLWYKLKIKKKKKKPSTSHIISDCVPRVIKASLSKMEKETKRGKKAFFWRCLLAGFNPYFYDMKKTCTAFLRNLLFIPTKMKTTVETAGPLACFRSNPNSYGNKVLIILWSFPGQHLD